MKKLSIIMAVVFAFAFVLTASSFAQTKGGSESSGGSDTMTSPRGTHETVPGTSQSQGQTQAGQMTTAQKASELIGKSVQGQTGEQIGEINDLVVDPTSGRIAYAVISASGAGLGDKLYPVPFTAFRTRPGETALTLNIDKQRLQSAPSFDKNSWPDMSSQTWQSDVNRFYGEQSMPGGRSAPSPGMSPGSMPGPSSPGSR